MNKQLICFAIIMLLSVGITSAFLDTTDSKSFEKGKKLIIGDKEISYNPLWEKYAPIEINTWFGLPLLSSKKMEGAITEHTETCTGYCESKFYITTYSESVLIDDIKFKELKGKDWIETSIKDYKLYIQDGEDEQSYDDFIDECEDYTASNGTTMTQCTQIKTGSHIVKTPKWIKYTEGTELNAGTYLVKLTGEKNKNNNIDWIITTQGKSLDSWATWSAGDFNVNTSTMITFGATSKCGFKFYVNQTFYLKDVSRYSTEGTFANLTGNSNNQLVKQNFNGLSASMNITLTAGSTYYLYVQGGTFNCDYTAVLTYPFANDEYVTFLTGYEIGGGGDYVRIGHITNMTINPSSTVTLNSPANYYNSTSEIVNFNCTAIIVGATFTNVSLWTNLSGTFQQDNSTTTNGGTMSLNMTNATAQYLWTCQGCADDGTCGLAGENRTLNVDVSIPVINITYPIAVIPYLYLGQNLSFNYTAIGTNLDSCWFEYEGKNTSISACTKNSTFIQNISKTITLWVNNSANVLTTTSSTWNSTIFLNSITYNTTSYETLTESFSANVSGSLTNANLIYNVTSYVGTISNGIITKSLSIPSSGNKSFFFSFNSGTINSTTYYQNVQPIMFGLCNSTLNITYLNITFKDESNSSEISASILSSTFLYYIGNASTNKTLSFSNSSTNPSYAFCASPSDKTYTIDPYLQYKSGTGYPQRIWNPSETSYTNVTTNQTLYLLYTLDGIQVTFQIVNNADQLLSGVDVTAMREIDGTNTAVASGSTGDDGTVTFILNSDFSHDFSFSKAGYTTYNTSFVPTQASYTITLGGGTTTVNDCSQGIDYNVMPIQEELFNNTAYSFRFNITSSYWDITSFGFSLRLANGSSAGSASSAVGGTPATLSYNINNQSIIYMDYYWNLVDCNSTSGSKYWIVTNTEYTSWSVKTFFTDLNLYMDSGLFGIDDFGKYLIIFLIIFITVGIMSYKYGMTSPMAITTMIFGTIFFFDVVTGLIPAIRGIEHLLTYLAGIVLVVTILKEVMQ